MSTILKRKFKCTGCGIDRPCFLETNKESNSLDYLVVDELKCVLDETNQTSFNWVEIYSNVTSECNINMKGRVFCPYEDPKGCTLKYGDCVNQINPK